MPEKPTYEELEKRVQELEQIELERKRIQEELAQIFSMSLDMICIADINTATFIRVNPAFTEILGHSEEAFLEKPFLDFVHPDDIDATRTIIEQKLRSGAKVINFENRYRCDDGSYRWLSWVSHPNPEQGLTYAIARDITERKNSQQALEKSKSLLDATGRMARVGGWELDTATSEVIWTEETYRIHEVPFDYKPPLQKAINFFHPEDRGRLEKAIKRSLDHGEPYDLELRFITAKGNHLWTRTTCQPKMVDGQIVQLKGTFQDITKRKNAEEALRKSEKDLRKTQQIAHLGSWRLDLATNKVEWTEELYHMYGFDPALPPPPYTEHMKLFTPESWERLSTSLSKTSETGIPYELELETVSEDGGNGWMWVRGETINDAAGKTIGLWGAAQDITERKQVEEALRKSEGRYKRIFENLQDVYYEAEIDGTILEVSPSIEKLSQYKRQELIGKSLYDIYADPKERDELVKLILDQGKVDDYEIYLKDKDGSQRICSLNTLLKRDNHGRPLRLIGSLRDISKSKQTEEAFRESEERFRLAFHTSPDSINLNRFDDGTYIDINEGFTKIMGYTREDAIGKSSLSLNIWKNSEDRKRLVDGLTKTGYVENMEAPFVRKDEKIRYGLMSAGITKISGEKVIISITRDITERKQAEEVSHKSHELLKLTESIANIGSWEWDVQHDRTHWSEELFRIFGRDPAKGAPPFALQSGFYANGDMQRLKDAVELCVKRGTPYEIELRAIRTDGEIRHCVSRGKVQYDENGKVFRLVGSFQDITDRKNSENQIKSLERRNQALLDYSPVSHKIVDLDFNLQYMSANGFKMLKLDNNADVYGKPYPFYFFPEVFKKDMIENLKKVKETGEANTLEAMTNDIEGNEVWLDSSLIPVFDEEEKINFITVVSADVTQRKQDEKEKDRLEERLTQAQKMESIGNLAGGIAHDFNNILFPIVGMSELLLEDLPPNSQQYENAQEILRAGKRGGDLVKQILAFSRQTEHKFIPVRIQKILKEVIRLTRATIPSYIEIDQDIQEDCGLVLADPTQIHQIAMNVITNAYHAVESNSGKIAIQLKETVLSADEITDLHIQIGRYVVLSISDSGHGISSDLMTKIFEPYFTTKEQGKGTGLGLSVAYGIIKEHKGDIKVYSEIGKGTTFNIYLPLMENPVDLIEPFTTEQYHTGSENILLVDDDEAIANVERQLLERLGYNVTVRVNSKEALEAFRRKPNYFDLVISDMTMPKMTGDQLAIELKNIRADIPVIICTGFSERINEENFKTLGICGLLMKPIVLSELAKTVRKVLDEAKG